MANHMPMNQSEEAYWKAVHAHIDALLDRPIEEHDAYLQAHCDDTKMRRDVKSWLGYIYAPSQVLDASAVTYAQALLDDHQPPDRPPLWSEASGNGADKNGAANNSAHKKETASEADRDAHASPTKNNEATPPAQSDKPSAPAPPRSSRTGPLGFWAAVLGFVVVMYLLFWGR